MIDLLVRLLQIPLEGAIDQTHLTRVFKAAYDVLYTYMIGNSRKNALYFAKYIDFFQTQISVKVSELTHELEAVMQQALVPVLVDFDTTSSTWGCASVNFRLNKQH